VPALADVAERRSSRGLCFVGKRDFGDFVTQFIEKRPATVVDYETGRELARKDNFFAFTVGQRAHVPGLSQRYFVVEKRRDQRSADFRRPGAAARVALCRRRLSLD
jgi:tRNA-specific 2-thiouridylase